MIDRRTALAVLKVVLGVVIAFYSALLIYTQLRGHVNAPFLALGLAELLAAILFLIPQTMKAGGLALIVIFVAGALLHVLHRDYNVGNLVVYAAAALAVVSDGTGK